MAATIKVFINNSAPQVEDDDLNGFKNENNNLILASGQVLSIVDSQQTNKAVAVYSAKGDFYDEAGGSAADVYVLDASDAQVGVFQLKDGMRIRMRVTNTNTGASTINVTSTGVKSIVYDAVPLTAGVLLAGQLVTLIFDEGNDRFDLIRANEVLARARFDGVPGSPTVLSSFNVASVVKNSTGNFTLNFTNSLGDGNYGYSFGTIRGSGGTFFEDTQAHIIGATAPSFNLGVAAWNAGGTVFSATDTTDVSVSLG